MTSPSSFTTLRWTTYHISLIIHHASPHHSSQLRFSHLTHHINLRRAGAAAASCVAGAVHRASWRSCGTRGRRWPRLPLAWQAQYTEPPRFPCARQAQYTELPGRAAARVAAAGPRLPFAWQAQYTEPLEELRRAWPPLAHGCLLRRALVFHLDPAAPVPASAVVDLSSPLITAPLNTSQLLITTHHNLSQLHFSHLTHHSSTAHHNSSQLHFSQVHFSSLLTGPLLITTYHIPTHHSSTSHTSPITSQLLITTHHNLSHPNSSQLHFSHLTFDIRTHHSPASHTWHQKSTSHTSLLTPPRSSH